MSSSYVNMANMPTKSLKFLEGWIEHKSVDGKWSKFWCVLSSNIIHIFNSDKLSKSSNIGSLEVGPGSRLVKKEGDEKTGYKFDLYTVRKVNRFKTSKFSERELWRAFVEGLSTGSVPDNIDLLPGQINDIQLSLNDFFKQQKMLRKPPLPIPSDPNNYTEGFDSQTSDNLTACEDYLEPVSPVNKIQKLVFYSDSRTEVPSWFFHNCSRELAIQILERGAKYGNTLMRESTNDTKNLVISKRMESSSARTDTHYVVNRLPSGYKIDVENPHEPMKSLSEVMDFFIETSGSAVTFPLTCNNLSKLGITEKIYNHYNTKIVKVLYDADSGEEIDSPTKIKNASDAPAPPPHIVKPNRSRSVPDIGQQVGFKMHNMSIKEGSPSIDPTNSNKIKRNNAGSQVEVSPPPLPPNHPSLQPPPLPPNHPPPLKQLGSLDSTNEPKRNPPRHTQSLSEIDSPMRKHNHRSSSSLNEHSIEVKTVTQVSSNSGASPLNEEQSKVPDFTLGPIVYADIKGKCLDIKNGDFQDSTESLNSCANEVHETTINSTKKVLGLEDYSSADCYYDSVFTVPCQSLKLKRSTTAYYKRRFSLRNIELAEASEYSTCIVSNVKSNSENNTSQITLMEPVTFKTNLHLPKIEEIPNSDLESYEKLENCLSLPQACKNVLEKANLYSQAPRPIYDKEIIEAISDEDYEYISEENSKNSLLPEFSSSSISEEIYEVLDEETQANYSTVQELYLNEMDDEGCNQPILSPRPISPCLLNDTYTEVDGTSNCSESDNQLDNYLVIFANDEDITAARTARGSFSGSSTFKTKGIGMKRCNSDFGREKLSEEQFKKRLEGLFGSSASRMSGLTSCQSVNQLSATNEPEYEFENVDHYLNVNAVKYRTNPRK